MEKPQALTIRLDGTDYAYSSHVMHNHLKGLQLWKYITHVAETDSKFEEYNADISKINSWIANTMDLAIGRQLAKFRKPKETQDYLSRLYTQSNSAKQYQLECDIKNVEQGTNSIHKFYIRTTELWNQLALMDPQFVCEVDATTFHTYRQETRLVQFFMAL